MKKHSRVALLLIAILTLTANPLMLMTTKKADPNVVHVPVTSPADDVVSQLEKLLQPEPEYNPFNDKDQMVVNRNTNTFYLYSVSDEAAITFEKESSLMVANGVKTITLDLHSPGGDLFAADVMNEQIRILKERGVHIRTIVEDKNACMSACPLIFMAGDERIAYANSVFMFHSPYMLFPYNTPEDVMSAYWKTLRISKDEYAAKFNQYCPADPTIKMDIYDHDAHFYRSDELAARCPGTFYTSIIPVAEQKSLTSFGL